MKRTVPLLITAVVGFTLIGAYFVPVHAELGRDGGHLVRRAGRDRVHPRRRQPSAVAPEAHLRSAARLGRTRSSCSCRSWGRCSSVSARSASRRRRSFPTSRWSGAYRQTGSAFWFSYQYAFQPLTATIFALLAFYIASAAFRAFRAKNLEASLLLGTAFIVLLGRTFAGVALTNWIDPENWEGFRYFTGLRLENLTVYIMAVFNTAGNRAIMIGIALGIVATSLKILIGVDRSYLGKDSGHRWASS